MSFNKSRTRTVIIHEAHGQDKETAFLDVRPTCCLALLALTGLYVLLRGTLPAWVVAALAPATVVTTARCLGAIANGDLGDGRGGRHVPYDFYHRSHSREDDGWEQGPDEDDDRHPPR